ncbi:MAG TPA: peptidylprolyl isomerase [Caulobacteraceae bacterium]|jgi:peptidyl-prolyl cis-trans isomerase SurA|nr:peptidylprolyl isomerase [Caulobacteraceae bacterium]
MRLLPSVAALAALALAQSGACAWAQEAALTPTDVPATDGQAAEKPLLSESVVVTVNDDIISSYDIVQRMRLLIVTSGIQPTDENIPELQREAVRSLIDEHLEMQDLKEEGKTQKFDLIASDSEVDDEIASIARSNNTSGSQLLAQLSAQGVGAQTFRDQLRAEISWRGWIRGRFGQRLTVGEDQIKAFQKRQEGDAGKPQYQISEIFIDANRAGGMQQAQDGASQLIAQIQKGAPFQAVARQFSSGPSAANGGQVGWITTGEMAPEVDTALEALRPGQLSAPIPVKDGVYIILLQDRHAGGATEVVHLKQAAVALPKTSSAQEASAAAAKLEELRPRLHGCDDLEGLAQKVPGVVAGDLGEAESKDLAPAFRDAVDKMQAGQISEPIRTDAGLHLIAVCDKHMGGANMLTHDQIEDRLYGQELAMIAKRELRDLRNSATIETR